MRTIYQVEVRDEKSGLTGMREDYLGVAKSAADAEAKALKLAKKDSFERPYVSRLNVVGELKF